MKNKVIVFIWWLICLPFRILFYIIGLFMILLTALMLLVKGKNK